MSRAWVIVALGAMLAAFPVEAQQAPAPATAPPMPVQQAFEAATKLYADGKYGEAVAAWDALAPRVSARPRSLAIVRARQALALFALGRDEEAHALAARALPLLAQAPELNEDRYFLVEAVAKAYRRVLDYASALTVLRAVEPIVPPGEFVAYLTYRISVATFVDLDAAKSDWVRLSPMIAAASKSVQGEAYIVGTELFLNLNDLPEAERLGRLAVSALGGLTETTTIADAVARSNLAIVLIRRQKLEEAQRFIAMSGAGRGGNVSFAKFFADIPDCGENGLKPEDMAIVEFSLGEDGAVSVARPVYAEGGSAAGLAFARAVRTWALKPEEAQKLSAFFRTAARMELRCSTAFARPSTLDLVRGAWERWAAEQGATLPVDDRPVSPVRSLAALRASLASLDAKGERGPMLALVLSRMVNSPVLSETERQSLAARALAALPPSTPSLARLLFVVGALPPIEGDSGPKVAASTKAHVARLLALAAQPPFRDDPEARAALALLAYDAGGRRDRPGIEPRLRAATEDGALPAANALKVGAWVRIASLAAARGDIDAASKAYRASGLSARECALTDAIPPIVKIGGAYPEELTRWGFEGTARIEYEIAADGATQRIRLLGAYPPFVFDEAATRTVAQSRFAKTYRPDGGPACSARQHNVKFGLPD